jgi:RING finger family protein
MFLYKRKFIHFPHTLERSSPLFSFSLKHATMNKRKREHENEVTKSTYQCKSFTLDSVEKENKLWRVNMLFNNGPFTPSLSSETKMNLARTVSKLSVSDLSNFCFENKDRVKKKNRVKKIFFNWCMDGENERTKPREEYIEIAEFLNENHKLYRPNKASILYKCFLMYEGIGGDKDEEGAKKKFKEFKWKKTAEKKLIKFIYGVTRRFFWDNDAYFRHEGVCILKRLAKVESCASIDLIIGFNMLEFKDNIYYRDRGSDFEGYSQLHILNALMYLKRACSFGHRKACLYLGTIYNTGVVEAGRFLPGKCDETSLYYYRLAYRLGDERAAIMAGHIYYRLGMKSGRALYQKQAFRYYLFGWKTVQGKMHSVVGIHMYKLAIQHGHSMKLKGMDRISAYSYLVGAAYNGNNAAIDALAEIPSNIPELTLGKFMYKRFCEDNGAKAEEQEEKNKECSICTFDFDDQGMVRISASCGHVLCGNCWTSIMGEKGDQKCPLCREKVETLVEVRI